MKEPSKPKKLINNPCKHCICRGDITICEATPCSIHDSWYVQELKKVQWSREKQLIIENIKLMIDQL